MLLATNKESFMRKSEKYARAGKYLQNLRRAADIGSAEMLVGKCYERIGYSPYSLGQIQRLESGYKEPTMDHFQMYQFLTQCDPAEIMKIPGLLFSDKALVIAPSRATTALIL